MCSRVQKLFYRVALTGLLLLTADCRLSAALLAFSNTNSITINDSFTPPTKALLYPSAINVTGRAGQVITSVTLSLNGFSHQFPSDVSVLLVGPRGQSAIIMSETGGQRRHSVTNLTLTFDDGATDSLPILTNLLSGTFKPTDGYLVLGYPHFPYDFPIPAPPGNSNSPSLLSVFNDTDPSGTWNLFVVDDASDYGGTISNGWGLNLSVAVSLKIAIAQTSAILSWPISATNCQLQATPTLSSLWTNVNTIPIQNTGLYVVTNPITPGTGYYRLTNH